MLSNRRQWFRVNLRARPLKAAGLTLAPQPLPLELGIIDLSAGGMLCQADQPVKRGGLIEVTLALRTGEPLTLKARVVRRSHRPTGRPPTYLLGCQFVDTTQAEQDALVGLVFGWELEARRAEWNELEAHRGRI